MGFAIEYGVPTDRCGLQLRLGAHKGFFRDEGVNFDLKSFSAGRKSLRKSIQDACRSANWERRPG